MGRDRRSEREDQGRRQRQDHRPRHPHTPPVSPASGAPTKQASGPPSSQCHQHDRHTHRSRTICAIRSAAASAPRATTPEPAGRGQLEIGIAIPPYDSGPHSPRSTPTSATLPQRPVDGRHHRGRHDSGHRRGAAALWCSARKSPAVTGHGLFRLSRIRRRRIRRYTSTDAKIRASGVLEASPSSLFAVAGDAD